MIDDPLKQAAESLSVGEAEELDRHCDRFEAAWRAGNPVRYEDHLVETDGRFRVALQAELIAIELEWRRRLSDGRATVPLGVPGIDESLDRTKVGGPEGSSPDATGDWRSADSPIETSIASPDSSLTITASGASRDPAFNVKVRYFGDFELQDELGRGGMGVVYKARQVTLNRPVALKMIKAGILANDAELQRFQNEAEAVALLDHPGIVPVYEVGDHDGQRYFSMKLVEGGNLGDQLTTFKADPRGAAALVAEVAEAVHHAHMRGILHRDLKPANILIDAEGHPHVTDFGLAKRVEGDVEMTQSGAILGTPAYMSPEQANGRRGSITTATDVYGLGAILYALLTGKAPFGGASVIETLDAVRTRPPEPPGKWNVSLPRDLDTICLKCLEKDPRRRYASARELAIDLKNWLESRPITARRVGGAERAWLWCQRKPAVAMLAASVVLAAVVGTASVIAVQAKANRDLRASNVKLNEQRARAEDRETQAIDAVKKFRDAVASEPELKNTPALDNLRKRLLKEPLAFFRALRDRLQTDSDTRPESLARLGGASFDMGYLTAEIGDKQDALIAYRESLAIRQKLADDNPTVTQFQSAVARSHDNIGKLLCETGEAAEGLKAYESALAIWRKLAVANPTFTQFQIELAGSHNYIGILLSETGEAAEGLKAFESAREIQQKLADANPSVNQFQSDLASSHHNIGRLLSTTGKPAEALKAYESSLAIQRKLADANPTVNQFQRDLASSYNNIGNLLSDTGKPAEGLKAYESALAIRRKLAAGNPTVNQFQSDLASSHHNIGRLLSTTGKPTEALKAHESALTIRRNLADTNPTVTEFQADLADCYCNIGIQLNATDKPAEALKAYESALTIEQKLVREHPESPDFASSLGGTLNNIAMLDMSANRLEEARVRLLEALKWQRKALAAYPANPTYRQFLANHLTNLAEVDRGLDDSEGAAEAERELAKLRDPEPAMLALDARLSDIVRGTQPRDNLETLQLAQWADEKELHVTSAKLWAHAFDADPKLAEDRQAQHRFDAACAAALAGCGLGKDDPPPDDLAKAKLRGQAREWLQAELAVWTKNVESGPAESRPIISRTLKHWREDPDLAGVREAAALAKLRADEQEAFTQFWGQVAALLKQVEADPK